MEWITGEQALLDRLHRPPRSPDSGPGSAPSPAAVVVSVRSRQGASLLQLVRAVRRRHPALPLVVHCLPMAGSGADLIAAGDAGVDGAAVHGLDDLATVVRGAMQLAAGRDATAAFAERLAIALPAGLAAGSRRAAWACLVWSQEPPPVTVVAERLDITRKTLAARLAAAGLPPAGVLVSWARVLRAAALLAAPGATPATVSSALGYASAAALRRMVARYAGLSLSALARSTGEGQAWDRFGQALRGDVGRRPVARAVAA